MTILKRYHLNHNAKYRFVLKIVTCIVISLLYQHYNENATNKSLEYRRKIDMSLDSITHRVLARYEKQNDIRNTRLLYKALPNNVNYKITNISENKNTYENLKRRSSNHMEDYLKCYNQRYTKKKGLKKLDCFYEKKLFKSLHKMEKIVAQRNKGKNSFQNIIYKKYVLPFTLLTLIPLFGVLLLIRHFNDLHTTRDSCKVISQGEVHNKYEATSHTKCEYASEAFLYINHIILFSMIFMTIFLIIYTIIKVAKYERIKHGY